MVLGEIEIITSLAKEEILIGMSKFEAIENAIKKFSIALNEALEYDFNSSVLKEKFDKRNKEIEKNLKSYLDRKNRNNLYEKKCIENKEKNKFILENKGLVYEIYRSKYKDCKLHEEDLIQEGFIGLMKACNNFENAKGYKFSTYAYYWIWGHMDKYLKRNIENKKGHNCIHKVDILSLNDLVFGNEAGNEYIDLLEDNTSITYNEDKFIINDFLEYAKTTKYYDICLMRMNEKTFAEIADIKNSSVQNIINKYKKAVDGFLYFYKVGW